MRIAPPVTFEGGVEMAKRSKRHARKGGAATPGAGRRSRSEDDDEERRDAERAADEAGGEAQLDDDADDGLDTDDTSNIEAIAERLVIGHEPDDEVSEDYGIDNIVGPLEAGLGGGLDQAEEARAGITDEEIARRSRRR